MLPTRPVLRWGTLTSPGKVRVANEDAVNYCEALGLFAVADGLGGLPSGEAASQISIRALPHLLEQALEHPRIAGDVSLGTLLLDAIIVLNRHMYQQTTSSPALSGMGATLVALIFEGQVAHIVHAGDSRAYLLRKGRLRQLTEDHHHTRGVDKPLIDSSARAEQGLLTQYMAMPGDIGAEGSSFNLQVGDRLLLCTDGLTTPIDNEGISKLLRSQKDAKDVCRALVDAANAKGGPDNITVAVADWFGYRSNLSRKPATGGRDRSGNGTEGGPAPGAAAAAATAPPVVDLRRVIQAAGGFRQALGKLERDLQWLLDGARETDQPSSLRSLAAAKRLLGAEAYVHYMSRHPSDNPLHVFHQVCTSPEGAWRRTYEADKAEFLPHLEAITSGELRISPLLSPTEGAAIFRHLWEGWAKVEQRYFNVCRRKALHGQEKSLDVLIEHMVGSVRTLIGLIDVLPRMSIKLPVRQAD